MFVIVLYFSIVTLNGCSGYNPGVLIDTKIVGGDIVDIKYRPYQVSIQFNKMHFCGGALITTNTIVSAAHCFGTSDLSPPYTANYGSNSTKGSSVGIQWVLVHEKYNKDSLDYDISLLMLESHIQLSPTVALIRLSETYRYQWGSLATVSGWGFENENGTVSPLLRKVAIPLVIPSVCQSYYKGLILITKNMLCAGFPEGGKDSCQGDSGGPLVQNNKLIGIVSFGMGCARKSYPGVYTNVGELASWVAQNSNYTLASASTYNLNNLCLISVILIVLHIISDNKL
ncbi:trypsin 3A1-like [Euwallacea fornicatus]|uniref:trypsin 3A1-like n=1 Tax=Euwallacea fornicatus TaxID=995702 RepID=UPI00338E2B84